MYEVGAIYVARTIEDLIPLQSPYTWRKSRRLLSVYFCISDPAALKNPPKIPARRYSRPYSCAHRAIALMCRPFPPFFLI